MHRSRIHASLTLPGVLGMVVATTSALATSNPAFTDAVALAQTGSATSVETRIAATAPESSQSQKNWADKLQRSRGAGNANTDPFSARSWVAPPKPAASAAPVVPPFPFRFIGKLSQEGAPPKLFLERADRLYTVSPGEVLDGQFRIDSIGETDLEVTYLPLDRKQRLAYTQITPPPTNYAQPVAPVTPLARMPDGAPPAGAAQPAPGPTASASTLGSVRTAPTVPTPAAGLAAYGTAALRLTPHGPTAVQPPSGASALQLTPHGPVPVQTSPYSPAPQGPAANAGSAAPMAPWSASQPQSPAPR